MKRLFIPLAIISLTLCSAPHIHAAGGTPITPTSYGVSRRDIDRNILMHGAIAGDGLDDAPAINAAIQYVSTNGGRVIIPPGDFTVGTNILLTANVHLVGSSSMNNPTNGSKLTLADAAECDLVVVPAGAWNVTIQGLQLDGNRTHQVGTNLCGIKMLNTTDDSDASKIHDVIIRSVSGYGLYATRREVLFSEVKVNNSLVGIYANSTHDSIWDKINVGHCDKDGIYYFNCGGSYWDIASYNHGQRGIVLDQCANNDFYRTMIDACGTHGLDITISVDGHYGKNNTFFGGRISCNGQNQNDTYANVHFGGAGTGSYVIDTKFIGVQFWTDVVDMDTSSKWPKYLLQDERTYTGWLAGDKISLLNCQLITGASPLNTKHFATSMFSSGFEDYATILFCDDFNGTTIANRLLGNLNIRSTKSLEWLGSVPARVTGNSTSGTIALDASQVYVGPSSTNTPTTFVLRTPPIASTTPNINGSPLRIMGGTSTGTGVGGSIQLYVSGSGTSGTNGNTQTKVGEFRTDRLNLSSAVSLTHNDGVSLSWRGSDPDVTEVTAYKGSITLNTNSSGTNPLWLKTVDGGTNGWKEVPYKLTGTYEDWSPGTLTNLGVAVVEVLVLGAVAGDPATAHFPMYSGASEASFKMTISANTYTNDQVRVTIFNGTGGDVTLNDGDVTATVLK